MGWDGLGWVLARKSKVKCCAVLCCYDVNMVCMYSMYVCMYVCMVKRRSIYLSVCVCVCDEVGTVL